jgi:membrane glycosyltransferase
VISSASLAAKALVFLTMSWASALFFAVAAAIFARAFAERRDSDSETYIAAAVLFAIPGVLSLGIGLWAAFNIKTPTFWLGMCPIAIALVFPPYVSLLAPEAVALHGAFVGIAVVLAFRWYDTSRNMRNRTA